MSWGWRTWEQERKGLVGMQTSVSLNHPIRKAVAFGGSERKSSQGEIAHVVHD